MLRQSVERTPKQLLIISIELYDTYTIKTNLANKIQLQKYAVISMSDSRTLTLLFGGLAVDKTMIKRMSTKFATDNNFGINKTLGSSSTEVSGGSRKIVTIFRRTRAKRLWILAPKSFQRQSDRIP